MTLWRGRILIPAASVALATALGLWYDRARDKWQRRIIADEADMAADILAYYAVGEYATNQTSATAWTLVRQQAGIATNVWGGWVSVDLALPAAVGALASNVYYYAARVRGYAECAPDRGWYEVYTNTAGIRLFDLGPSGGGYRGRRVGGWVLKSAGLGYDHLALPRGFGLASGWLLTQPSATEIELEADGYDPADITVTPGAVASNRVVYWQAPTLTVQTNTIDALPLRGDYWTPDTTAPLAIYAPRSPWEIDAQPAGSGLRDTLNTLLTDYTVGSYARHWLNSDVRPTGTLTDWTGWTNATPAALDTSAAFVAARSAWQAIDPATNLLASWQAAVTALGYCDAFRAGYPAGVWTNGVRRLYTSQTVTPSAYTNVQAAYDALIADPQWTLTTATTNTTETPRYLLEISYSPPGSSDYLSATYTVTTGQPLAYLGVGHSTNLYAAASAHTWPTAGLGVTLAPPTGETLVTANALTACDTDSSVAGPEHLFSTFVPGYTNAPPSAWWPANLGGNLGKGYILSAPVIVAAPTF